MKKDTNQNEGVIDAKNETAVAVVETGAVSTQQVNVAGVSLRFPFVRVGQAMSQWRCNGKAPIVGDFYIGKDKQINVHLAEMGQDAGLNVILLDVVPGVMEDKPFTGAANPPQRWVGPNAEAEAAEAGFSLTPVPTGEVWPDSGRPKMRANASRFCYLQMLVPVPEDFDAVDFQVFPIGEKLYTPARIEFSKGAFKSLSEVIGNIERMEKFRNRKVEGYEFSWRGKVCHVYTAEAVSKQTGATYPLLKFSLAMNGGKTVELDTQEREDFTMFLASVTSTTVDIGEDTPEF